MQLRIIPSQEVSEAEYGDYMDEWEQTGEAIVPTSSARRGRSFAEMGQKWTRGQTDKAFEDGFVPNSVFFLTTDQGRILGSLSFRHVLNERLQNNGGHIGYGIRPSERRKGYGRWMLDTFLRSSSVDGLGRVLLTCDEVNEGSARTIEACGGRLWDKKEWEGVWTRRYWIDIPNAPHLEAMLRFVRETLACADVEATKARPTPFRKRSEHTGRVLAWARRLAPEYPDLDREAVEIAAIFHDVGYATCSSPKEHARDSALLCRRYLLDYGMDPNRTEKIVQLVADHSRKDLMKTPQVSAELLVLMEADLLDETGALGVVWDCLAEGQKSDPSFVATYEHIGEFTQRGMTRNPLRSTLGRRFWDEKKALVDAFVRSLETDLNLTTSNHKGSAS